MYTTYERIIIMATYQIDGKTYETSLTGLYIDRIWDSHYFGDITVAYDLQPLACIDYDGLFSMDPCWSSDYNRSIFIETKADPSAEDETLFEPVALIYSVWNDDESIKYHHEVKINETERLMLQALMATKYGFYKEYVFEKGAID